MNAIADPTMACAIATDRGTPRVRLPSPREVGVTKWGKLPPEISLRQFAVLMVATWAAFIVALPYLT